MSSSDIQDFGYEMEERQRQLEEKVQLQNDETREIVREVMTRQHEDSLRRSESIFCVVILTTKYYGIAGFPYLFQSILYPVGITHLLGQNSHIPCWQIY